jgi:hypothetical protein
MRCTFAALILLGFTLPAASQTTTSPSLITMVRTGWNAESFAVVTQGPVLNPQHCPIPDGYVTDSSQPGYNTYYAAALAAYVSNSPVLVVIFDPPLSTGEPIGTGVNALPCDQGRPRLIGIDLSRSGH